FKTDRTCANDDEMFGAALELEHRFIGEIWCLRESRDWRHCRRRAGRDHEAPRRDLELVADHGGRGILEARRAFDHVYTETGETLLGIVRRDCCDHAVHMRIDLGEIDLDRKSTRLNSSHVAISYAVFCLKKKNE